jgi:AraC family transcriptional regulator of adaptative response / DNA-3-methyladenine glycosylase II
LARQAAARIEAGALNNGASLEQLACELGISSRQLRRSIREEFGVSPVELAQTRRLLLAKQLLGESDLPMIDVAHSSGFSSVRRFNALFRTHYGFPPSHVRRSRPDRPESDSICLTLSFRPPYAWREMLRFLARRATAGVECVTGESYSRSVAIGDSRGWLRVSPRPGRNALAIELAAALCPVLPEVLARLRRLFDLCARPDAIDSQLASDNRLAKRVHRAPGMRVPGAFDGFELAVRAILGQRISVAAASTLAARVTAALGASVETPMPCLTRLAVAPERLAAVSLDELTCLGIPSARASSIRELARGVLQGAVTLEPGADPEIAIQDLTAVSGIGEWTANYIALRALRWPDAFPASDLGLLRAWGAKSPAALRKAAESWRPWRGYAAMHLWNSNSEGNCP